MPQTTHIAHAQRSRYYCAVHATRRGNFPTAESLQMQFLTAPHHTSQQARGTEPSPFTNGGICSSTQLTLRLLQRLITGRGDDAYAYPHSCKDPITPHHTSHTQQAGHGAFMNGGTRSSRRLTPRRLQRLITGRRYDASPHSLSAFAARGPRCAHWCNVAGAARGSSRPTATGAAGRSESGRSSRQRASPRRRRAGGRGGRP